MSLSMDIRPGRWARACAADGGSFDYCSALGMGDFDPQAWGTDANNNNFLQSIFVRNDINGLIASIDNQPGGTIYGPDGETGTILVTSTFSSEGVTILTYTPGVGDFDIIGNWSVEINGLQVTLVTGDTCTVNFNQTFYGGAGNVAPEITSAIITGSAAIGEVITASYTYYDADGDTENTTLTEASIEWYRYDNSSGTSGETLLQTGGVNYTVVSGDSNKYLGYKITPYATFGASPGAEVESTRVEILQEAYTLSTTKQTSFTIQQNGGVGTIAWGDGNTTAFDHSAGLLTKSHTYASPGTYNVVVYCDPSDIMDLRVHSQNLTGTLDISKLDYLYRLYAYTNANLTLISNPTTNAAASDFLQYWAYSTGITTWAGSGLTKLGGSFRLENCSSLAGTLTMPTSSVAYSLLQVFSTAITAFDWSGVSGAVATFAVRSNSSLATMTNGTASVPNYRASDNALTSLDCSGITNCTSFQIYGNSGLATFTPPSTSGTLIVFYGYSCSLPYFDLTSLTFDADVSIRISDNSMTVAEVNQLLVDMDSTLSNSSTSGVIQIAGTNAAPDGSSGGYDGTTAKSNLIAEGYNVSTS